MRVLVTRSCPAVAACVLLLSGVVPLWAQAPAPVGRIKAAVGASEVLRAGQSQPARVGDVVYESDTLRTGADGRLAVMLKDETRLSLGAETELSLTRFAYQPGENRLDLVLRLARGALSYVSGRIAALMPDAVRLETPTAVIGVRGTHALVRAEAP